MLGSPPHDAVSRAMTGERDLDRLLALILESATELLHADRCSLFVVDHEAGELWTRIAQGSKEIRLPLGSGIAGSVAQSAEIVNIPDAYSDERFNPENDKRSGYKTTSMLCMPLVSHESKVVGVLQALNKAGGAFDDYDEKIAEALCSHAAVAIDTAQLIAADMERQRLQNEMGLARDIQQGLLPQDVAALPGWKLAQFQQPCDDTGGDYHDYLPTADGLDLVVGDVSGHGVGAALMMSTARAFLRALREGHDDLVTVISKLNNLLEADMADESFMTMLLLRMKPDGSVRYVSAGHEPPIVYRKASNSFDELDSTGLMLSMIEDSEYDCAEVPAFAAGDILVAYTDGLFEATSPEGEEWGIERLQQTVAAHAAQGAEAVCRALVDGVEAHMAGTPHTDDLTIVVAERTA